MACIGATTHLRAQHALTRNTSAHPRTVVKSAAIGTIKGLGVVLCIRPLTITNTEPMITGPMPGPERMGDP